MFRPGNKISGIFLLPVLNNEIQSWSPVYSLSNSECTYYDVSAAENSGNEIVGNSQTVLYHSPPCLPLPVADSSVLQEGIRTLEGLPDLFDFSSLTAIELFSPYPKLLPITRNLLFIAD
jgi:hypothetical protein